jgi:hypothetical protein
VATTGIYLAVQIKPTTIHGQFKTLRRNRLINRNIARPHPPEALIIKPSALQNLIHRRKIDGACVDFNATGSAINRFTTHLACQHDLALRCLQL